MIEFENLGSIDPAKSADQQAPSPEKNLQMAIRDMRMRIEKYTDAEIEKLCELMGVIKIIDTDKRTAIQGFIDASKNLSEAENLDRILQTAEERLREQQ